MAAARVLPCGAAGVGAGAAPQHEGGVYALLCVGILVLTQSGLGNLKVVNTRRLSLFTKASETRQRRVSALLGVQGAGTTAASRSSISNM